jgi:hypothetical protein
MSHHRSCATSVIAFRFGIAVLAAGLAKPLPTMAQRQLLIDATSGCSGCSIAVAKVATPGTPSDSVLLSTHPQVLQDSRGRFLAIGSIPRAQILIYSQTGALADAIGRAGDGPGEFRDNTRITLLTADSLLVVEEPNRRISVLSSDGSYARRFIVPFAPLDVELVEGDALIGGGAGFEAGAVAQPLHRLSMLGSLEKSFGGPVAILQRRPSAAQRMVARSRQGFWSIRPDRYELQQWSTDGALLTAIDRQVDWFPDREFEGARNAWSDPVHPFLRDVYEDASGLLWTLTAVAASGFRPSRENYGLPPSLHHVRLDSMLEVFDTKTGTLIASQRFPWAANSFTNTGLLVSYHEDDSGIMVLDLLRPAVVRNP